MKGIRFGLLALVASIGFSLPASAVYNATADGTVVYFTQMGSGVGFIDGTVVFAISGQPPNPCQVNGYQQFVISSNSVDAETRRSMIATLIAAKMSGSQVRVAYDHNGGWCDQNALAVHWLSLL